MHKKVGEDNFLSVKGGLAVTGFFFEVRFPVKCLVLRLIVLILFCHNAG